MKIKERANLKEDMESRRCKIIERKKEEGKMKKKNQQEAKNMKKRHLRE